MALTGAVDTNVLLRYLLEDDLAQLAAVKILFRRAVTSGEMLFVPVTVMLELEWVLRSFFRVSKHAFIQMAREVLSSTELELQAEDAVEFALESYGQSTADYADCLHAALTADSNRGPFWTFDKTASKVEGAKLLSVSP